MSFHYLLNILISACFTTVTSLAELCIRMGVAELRNRNSTEQESTLRVSRETMTPGPDGLNLMLRVLLCCRSQCKAGEKAVPVCGVWNRCLKAESGPQLPRWAEKFHFPKLYKAIQGLFGERYYQNSSTTPTAGMCVSNKRVAVRMIQVLFVPFSRAKQIISSAASYTYQLHNLVTLPPWPKVSQLANMGMGGRTSGGLNQMTWARALPHSMLKSHCHSKEGEAVSEGGVHLRRHQTLYWSSLHATSCLLCIVLGFR